VPVSFGVREGSKDRVLIHNEQGPIFKAGLTKRTVIVSSLSNFLNLGKANYIFMREGREINIDV
jgi:hypothetical protein